MSEGFFIFYVYNYRMIDNSFSQFLFQNRNDFLTDFFLFITQFGAVEFVGVIIFMIGVYFFVKRKYAYVTYFLVAAIGSSFSVYFLKNLIHRTRPGGDIAYYIEQSFSFPSGHATMSMALYGSIIGYLYISQRFEKYKLALTISLYLIIFLIGLSRIYLGVHYLSDVIGGFLVGFIWIMVARSLVSLIKYPKS